MGSWRRLRTEIPAALAGVALALMVTAGMVVGGEQEPVTSVGEWEDVPASDVEMPSLTRADLLAEFDKVAAAGKRLRSWEARCRVTSQRIRQTPPWRGVSSASANAADYVTTTHSLLLGCCGQQWFCERRSGDWQDEKVEYRNLCDGLHVQTIVLSEKPMIIHIRTQSEFAALMPESKPRPELPVGSPPFLETTRERCYPIPESLPNMRGILADPDAKVLPWRTRVDGHTCYVVERTTVRDNPIFRSLEESEAWQKQNPERQVVRMVNPDAKPDDKRTEKVTVRLALDPESGYVPARWSTTREVSLPEGYPRYPSTGEEITCTDFGKYGDQGYIAGRFQYIHYDENNEGGNQEIVARREVLLESFRVDREYPSDCFHIDPPEGCRVLDSVRGIQYTAGDSEEKIAALLEAAKAKKAFFEALKKKPAPPLEGELWLNSEPIRLEDARGKNVELYFWSIGCGPCRHELPRFQQDWKEWLQSSDSTVFLSIHPYVDGRELQQLKDLLRKQKITFPVMVDSREPDNKAWGKTYARYCVYSMPTSVRINSKGYVAHHDSERGWVAESSRWMRNLTQINPNSKNAGETKSSVEPSKD